MVLDNLRHVSKSQGSMQAYRYGYDWRMSDGKIGDLAELGSENPDFAIDAELGWIDADSKLCAE